MFSAIGERRWKRFLNSTKRRNYDRFISKFLCDTKLKCQGPISDKNKQCPRKFIIDIRSKYDVDKKLRYLHVDHEYDVQHTCWRWKRNLLKYRNKKLWHGSTDKKKLLERLFEKVAFRCHPGCHDIQLPHYQNIHQTKTKKSKKKKEKKKKEKFVEVIVIDD